MRNVALTLKIVNYPPVAGCRYDSRSDSYRPDKIFGSIPALNHARFRALRINGFHPRFSEALPKIVSELATVGW
jgi:hypothetical protein